MSEVIKNPCTFSPGRECKNRRICVISVPYEVNGYTGVKSYSYRAGMPFIYRSPSGEFDVRQELKCVFCTAREIGSMYNDRVY